MVKLFVSYSHKDSLLKERLLDNLETQLKIRDFEYSWWHDSHLLPGEEWEEEILHKAAEADGALHLISPNFLGSDFIRDNEIKVFLEEPKFTIPVMLRKVPLKDHRIDWLTLDRRQIFTLDGADFSSIRGTNRIDEFTGKLASQMIDRIENL